jgi:hypothetical protein
VRTLSETTPVSLKAYAFQVVQRVEPFTSNLTRTVSLAVGTISRIVPVTFDFCDVYVSPTLYVATDTVIFFLFSVLVGFAYILSITEKSQKYNFISQ